MHARHMNLKCCTMHPLTPHMIVQTGWCCCIVVATVVLTLQLVFIIMAIAFMSSEAGVNNDLGTAMWSLMPKTLGYLSPRLIRVAWCPKLSGICPPAELEWCNAKNSHVFIPAIRVKEKYTC